MKPFTTIAAIVFSLISSMHLLRLFFRWEVVANGVRIPMWISLPGFVVTAGLALMLWREVHE
jgi:hypothetical protein